ncbi:MAG: peptidase, partial [Chloroflexi bacterium RBG_16_63_12]
MPEPKIAPYGSWKSPITSDLIVAETIGLGGTAIEGDDVYWMELRPKEGGRLVVVQRRRTPESKTTDLTPMPFNARTRVHEYGGRAYAVADGTAYFSNFADQRLYRQDPGAEPRPITPEIALRYADYVVDRRRNRLFCVREDHTAPGEAVNTLVTVKCDGDESGGQVIISGNNFYSSPRLGPDGSRLAWLTWNHPNMPWDGTELWAGEVNADGSLGHAERVAGGPAESVFQPEWSPDGVLYFVSDRTGWWNLYRWQKGNIEPLCPMEAEFGEPQWNFGMSTYAFESPGRIICTYTQKGTYHLASLDTATLKLEEIPTPYTDVGSVRAAPGRVLFLAGSPTEPWSIVHLDLRTRQFEVLRRTSAIKVNPGYVSTPEEIEFPTEGGLTAHAFFYAPGNRDFTAPAGEKPPLIVMSHGGPTAAVSGVFNPNIQYWTSRGFAVMDVNYGGSTG